MLTVRLRLQLPPPPNLPAQRHHVDFSLSQADQEAELTPGAHLDHLGQRHHQPQVGLGSTDATPYVATVTLMSWRVSHLTQPWTEARTRNPRD